MRRIGIEVYDNDGCLYMYTYIGYQFNSFYVACLAFNISNERIPRYFTFRDTEVFVTSKFGCTV